MTTNFVDIPQRNAAPIAGMVLPIMILFAIIDHSMRHVWLQKTKSSKTSL